MENKLLELFAGSRSVGKEAEKLGYEVFSSDINEFDGIDYAVDIVHISLLLVLVNIGIKTTHRSPRTHLKVWSMFSLP